MSAPAVLVRRSPVAVDSIALIATSALSAVTGIAFWTLAARLIPPHQLGIETAILSLMTTAGAVAASGPGNAITAMLPATGLDERRPQLIHACTVVGVGALVTGTVAGVVGALTVGPPTVVTGLLVVGGALILAFFAFKDTVLTALSAASRLPLLNLVISVLKALLLPLALVCSIGMGAVAATLSAAIVALLVVWSMVPGLLSRQLPADEHRREHRPSALVGFALRDGTASLVSMGSLLAAPFLTTWLAGPVEGAILALMLPVAQGLDFVSTGAAMALTKHLSGTRGPAARRTIWRVWALSQVAVIALAAVLLFGLAPVLFRFFGHGYDRHTLWATLAVLCLGSIARVTFVIWAAVLRAQMSTRTLLATNVAASLVTIPVLVTCIAAWGAVGAGIGAGIGSAVLGAAGAVGLVRGTYRHHTRPAIEEKS